MLEVLAHHLKRILIILYFIAPIGYCERHDHLYEFCFRHAKKEKKERLNALKQKRALSFVVPKANAKVRFLENFILNLVHVLVWIIFQIILV